MPTLTIARADIKRLCAIDTADTSQDAAIDALLAAEESVQEYALDPATLAASAGDAGLRATLTLGVAEVLAGSFLRQIARAPGYTDDFHIGPLDVSASKTDNLAQLGERLGTQGLKRLEPFQRAAKMVASDAVSAIGDGSSKIPLLAQTLAAVSIFDAAFGDAGDTP